MNRWAFARIALGLSDSEFWHLEPRQYIALRDRWELEEKRKDRRVATICTIIANCNRVTGSPTWEIDDFMPRYEPEEKPKVSNEQTKANILMLHAMMGGEMPGEGGKGDG